MIHDYCYGDTKCRMQKLIYFIPYKWKCNGGYPYCGNSIILFISNSIGLRRNRHPSMSRMPRLHALIRTHLICIPIPSFLTEMNQLCLRNDRLL